MSIEHNRAGGGGGRRGVDARRVSGRRCCCCCCEAIKKKKLCIFSPSPRAASEGIQALIDVFPRRSDKAAVTEDEECDFDFGNTSKRV